jgi:nickel superoxide dismutase
MGFKPTTIAAAHCDLPCGVYDPAQAKIEAQSVKACMEKYAASTDADFKARAVSIKEERSHLVKEHLWVLWTDYFKPNHFEAYPNLHQLFNDATKLAGAAGTKGSTDVAIADNLISKIDEIAEIFWATKK